MFSDKGTVYSARAYKIPECSRTATGTPLVQVNWNLLTVMIITCFLYLNKDITGGSL